jgi:hypothetical protein
MKASNFEIPEFESKDQEAQWWAANPDLILAKLEAALSEGRLRKGTSVRRQEQLVSTLRERPVPHILKR